MIEATQNHTPWDVGELLGLAARENNAKRGYLLVNRRQAKHVPVSPGEALAQFAALGERVYAALGGRRAAFVGFAETATAIGAHVAARYPGEGYLLQTTREQLPSRHAVVDFREEHSHATQQMLFCEDRSMLERADTIVFVEDEITTGKTILNFVDALERRGIRGPFAAASLVNGMEPEQLMAFARRGIGVCFLLSVAGSFRDLALDDRLPEAGGDEAAAVPPYSVRKVQGLCSPGLGVRAALYRDRCGALARTVCGLLEVPAGERVLVLGTEECMYPAICCGAALEGRGHTVRVHATTRSPILVGGSRNPLFCRTALESVYEAGRKTYLYNLARYDRVVVVTDAAPPHPGGLRDLAGALGSCGNDRVQVIRWVP